MCSLALRILPDESVTDSRPITMSQNGGSPAETEASTVQTKKKTPTVGKGKVVDTGGKGKVVDKVQSAIVGEDNPRTTTRSLAQSKNSDNMHLRQ